MMTAILRYLLCLCLLLSMAACGFKLRGNYDFPAAMAVTYVQASDQTSELVRELKRALRSSGVQLANASNNSAAVLNVTGASGRRTIWVGTDGRTSEFEVFYNASFSVTGQDETFAIEQQTLSLTRQYVFDRLGVLAANEEEELLKKDMQRELARLIMDRIAAAADSQNTQLD